MKVAVLLEKRRENWLELDRLCGELRRRKKDAAAVSRFASLYRAACADLALADAYQLPSSTVQYLHQLVGRAHNQLYRSRQFDYRSWGTMLLVDVPQRLFRDRCVQFAFVLFWAVFIGSAALAYFQADWAPQVFPGRADGAVGGEFQRIDSGAVGGNKLHDGGLLHLPQHRHRLSLLRAGDLNRAGDSRDALQCVGAGSHVWSHGTSGGAQGANFFNFVTAHGPFELTAIALSAGAGLRLGMGWIRTGGLTRTASLRKTAIEAGPLMCVAMLLFFLAAMIEGFVSPTSLPYPVKAGVAVLASGMLMFYLVVLGFPRRSA